MTNKKRCPTCKERIHKDARKCPHCQSEQPMSAPQGIVAVIVLIVMVGLGLLGFKSCGDSAPTSPDQMRRDWERAQERINTGHPSLALSMAQGFVKERLVAPGSAEWPSFWEPTSEHVTALDNKRYRVRSWVDSQNRFGALLRIEYTAVVVDAGNDRWTLESLDLDD